MKKTSTGVFTPLLLIPFVMFFSSCLKDNCRHSYRIYTPVYTKLSTLRATVASKPAQAVNNPGKMFTMGKLLLLNEQNKGIHIIDNSNPGHPVNTSFINIPGNVDLYASGNILYADLYTDLAAIDITNPTHVNVTKFLTKAFPEKALYTSSSNPDSINILTSWTARDTIVDCAVANSWYNCVGCGILLTAPQSAAYNSSNSSTKASGQAGSMARFAAVNSSYLYAVTASDLNIIDISDAAHPLFVQKKNIGWGIETIFPYNNKLYIGAGSNMSVFDVQDPLNPTQLSWNGHWCSHDPVVADDNYAYVTLHDANACSGKINQLEIYSLSTPSSPLLINTVPLTHPQGLSKDGDLIFVCDDGLKIYNATNVKNLQLLQHFKTTETYDVIAQNGIAIVVAKDGIYQYSYTDLNNIHLISTL